MNDDIAALSKELMDVKARLSEARRNAKPEPVQDYEFRHADGAGTPAKLSDLFGDHDELLVVHNMGSGCAWCTLWADGFNGLAKPLHDRAGFALCSADEHAKAHEFASSRGWTFPVVSGSESDFAEDMGFVQNGQVWPGVSAFKKLGDGSIVRTGWDHFGPGDDYCSAWRLFDLFENGAGDWAPKFEY